MISVVIPVGPFKGNTEWLNECVHSIREQTLKPVQEIYVDDGSGVNFQAKYNIAASINLRVLRMYWRTGISHCFNYGVMAAPTECVFMLGSDDTLEPTCLAACWEAYNKRDKADGYYSVPIRYMDTQEVQTAPCNAAMITKGFMRLSGGFPIETSIGIGDSTLLSICLAHHLPVYWVGEDAETPLYNYRRHPDIHTYKIPWGIADPLRSYLTEKWSAEEVKQWAQNY